MATFSKDVESLMSELGFEPEPFGLSYVRSDGARAGYMLLRAVEHRFGLSRGALSPSEREWVEEIVGAAIDLGTTDLDVAREEAQRRWDAAREKRRLEREAARPINKLVEAIKTLGGKRDAKVWLALVEVLRDFDRRLPEGARERGDE